MATRFVMLTGASLGGTSIDGVREFSFDETIGTVEARSDGQLGAVSSDIVRSDVTGSLVVEDWDSMADVMSGSDLVPTYFTAAGYIGGRTAYDIHVGVSADSNGLVFTGFDMVIDSEPGSVATLTMTWEAMFHPDNVQFLGTSAQYLAGTALATIEAQ